MDIPEFPTDNLYKFLTLFGLALIVGGVALPIHEEHYYAELGRDLFSKSITAISEGVMSYADTSKSPNSAATKEVVSAIEKMRSVIITGLEMTNAAERVARCWKIGIGSVIFGSVMSVFGFWSWYDRHQKYQDKILVRRSQLINPGGG